MSDAKAAPREIDIIILATLEGLKLPLCVKRRLSLGALLGFVEDRGLLRSSCFLFVLRPGKCQQLDKAAIAERAISLAH
ncbi:hypothetical protein LVY75_35015 (plasmid) [Sinorhizobium sp. B11]